MLNLPYELQKAAAESERLLNEMLSSYDNELFAVMKVIEQDILRLLDILEKDKSGNQTITVANLSRAISARKELIIFVHREVKSLSSDWTSQFDKVQDFIINNIPDSGIPTGLVSVDGEILNSVKKIANLEYYGNYVTKFKKDIICELLIGGDFNKIVKKIEGNLTQQDLFEQGDQLKYSSSIPAMAKRIGHDILMGIYAITHATKAKESGMTRFMYF